MKIRVDPDKCQGHARCYGLAPELFDVDDYGQASVIVDQVPAELEHKAHLAIGRITYPDESECRYLLYLKSSCTGDEDVLIGEYRHRSPDFPHESTADQFFNEGQFEAYRALGQHIGEKAVKALAPKSLPDQMTFSELASCFQALWDLEERRRAENKTATGIRPS